MAWESRLVGLWQAPAPSAVDDSQTSTPQSGAHDATSVLDIPVLVDTPNLNTEKTSGLKSRPARSHAPSEQRKVSIYSRDAKPLSMHKRGPESDGVETYTAKGGVVIVSESLKYGMLCIEAEEAEISRGPKGSVDNRDKNQHRDSLQEDINFPMDVHFKGSVVVRRDQSEIPGHQREKWTIRASEVEYDYAADLLVATDAKMDITSFGSREPAIINAGRLKFSHSMERQPDGSLVPSEQREISIEPHSL